MKLRGRSSGQGLIEYLILLCLVSVSAIAVVSVVGQNLRARYATISASLRGEKDTRIELESVESNSYELRGFDDYAETSVKPSSHRSSR